MRSGKIGKKFLIFRGDGECLAGVGGVEIGGEVDEIGDGDLSVEIQVANTRGTDEDIAAAHLGNADGRVGMRGEGRIKNSIARREAGLADELVQG